MPQGEHGGQRMSCRSQVSPYRFRDGVDVTIFSVRYIYSLSYFANMTFFSFKDKHSTGLGRWLSA